MRRFRKVSLAVLVWATAASTLISGTPHFVCRCPDGQVKPFCLGFLSSSSKCCCGDHGCCSTKKDRTVSNPAGERISAGCCCSDQEEHKTPEKNCEGSRGGQFNEHGDSLPENAVKQTCCQKTLAKANVFSFERAEINAADGGFVSLAQVDLPSIATATPCLKVWQVYRIPPPTDLVVTLQHLVI